MIDKIWEKYDADQSGELDFQETKCYIKDLLGKIPDDVFKQIFNEFDKDGSGSIGKEEMAEFMKMFEDIGESSLKISNDIQELEDCEANAKKFKLECQAKDRKGGKEATNFKCKSHMHFEKQHEQETSGNKIKLLKLKMKQ